MYWVYVHVWPSSPRRCVVPCWARWMQEAGRVGVDRGAGGRSGRSLSWEQQETKPLTCKNQHRHPYVRHSSLATEHALTQRTRFQFNLIRRLIIHVMRPHFSGFSWRYVVEDKWEQLGGETASSTLGWWERDRSALSEDESALIPLSLSLHVSVSRPIRLYFLFPFHLLLWASISSNRRHRLHPHETAKSYHHLYLFIF